VSKQSSDMPEEVNKPGHKRRRREKPYEVWGRNSNPKAIFQAEWSKWGAYETREIADNQVRKFTDKYHSKRYGKFYEFGVRIVVPKLRRKRVKEPVQ